MDLNEIINPKKTLVRRMAEAEGEGPKQETRWEGTKFGKAWTLQEKSEQAKALARKLRERG